MHLRKHRGGFRPMNSRVAVSLQGEQLGDLSRELGLAIPCTLSPVKSSRPERWSRNWVRFVKTGRPKVAAGYFQETN
jgi:hypothetical protein